MKDLLIYIAQNLVDNPNDVTVTEKVTDSETLFELRVNPSDMGKIIGRQGKVAKEIRALMRAVAMKQGKRISIDIVD